MEVKESIVFYKSFYDAIKELPVENQIEVYNAVFKKYFYNQDEQLNGISKGIFGLIIPNIDSANKRYFANIENGKKGGRPKTQLKPNDNPIKTQLKPNDNLNDNDNVNVNDNDNKKENIKRKVFKKPTLEELKEYIEEINSSIDAQHFIDYYESNGWKVGKNQMKDWKATLRNWSRTEEPKKEIKKEPLPEWLNKDIKEAEASQEEINELEKLLGGI